MHIKSDPNFPLKDIWNPASSTLLSLHKLSSTAEWKLCLINFNEFVKTRQVAGAYNMYYLRHMTEELIKSRLAQTSTVMNYYSAAVLHFGAYTLHQRIYKDTDGSPKSEEFTLYVLGDRITTEVDSTELSTAIAQSNEYLIKAKSL